MSHIDDLREQTYQEARELLKAYRKCAIIRPTGFGKTGLLTRFIASGEYNKILYLYPAEVIKNTVLDFYKTYRGAEHLPDVQFMTYLKLTLLKDDELEKLRDIDLIICDECHRLGAPETVVGLTELIEHSPDACLLGATATPERADMVDEIALFFEDHVTSKYTLHDAFQDGILHKPYYCFCAEGDSDPEVLNRLKKDAMLQTNFLSGEERRAAQELVASRVTEIANLSKMDEVFRNTLSEVNIDPSYQKYIVFCRDFKQMRSAKKKMKSWLISAFPRHSIHELTVSSEDSECISNTHKLSQLASKPDNIDLIYSCNMLNMGYHVGDLTGIVMYRGTFSSICYIQQLGRALSTGDAEPKIVFDIVDNLHRKSIYAMMSEDSRLSEDSECKVSPQDIREYELLVKKTCDKDDSGRPIKLTKKEKTRLAELAKIIKIAQDVNSGKRGTNVLKPEDLVVTSYTASYRELIAKTVAEPLSMRCRQAWARWLEKGGDASVMTREYILGQKAPQATPLPPFCKLKNVSINAVLDEMGVV